MQEPTAQVPPTQAGDALGASPQPCPHEPQSVGLVLGSAFGRGPAAAGFVAGAVCGTLLGLLAAAGPGLRVASAMGVAALLMLWPIIAAVLVFRHGIDTAKLRQRFVPEQTIETTKETIKWLREQMPLGRKS